MPDETFSLAKAGLQVGAVYQDYNNTIDRFSAADGSQQASAALNLAANLIRQPKGSAIYFSVDFDPDKSELTASIIPHFEAIAEQFAHAGSPYQIGAYGSGLTLQTLLDKNLIQYAWLYDAHFAPRSGHSLAPSCRRLCAKCGHPECGCRYRRLRANNSEALRDPALAGLGVGRSRGRLMPHHSAAEWEWLLAPGDRSAIWGIYPPK
jgi:hypothetical protein